MQGNIGWRPEEKHLLQLPRLMEIRNVSWTAECMDCWLVRNVSEQSIRIFSNPSYNVTHRVTCFTSHYRFSNFLVLLARYRFLVRKCRSWSDCVLQRESNSTFSFPCWYTNQCVVSAQIFLGILGCCLNLIAFFNILLSKSLREKCFYGTLK